MICPKCGIGQIVPTAKSGRIAPYNFVNNLPIPADLEIPTCTECGEEWIDADTNAKLDAALKDAWTQWMDRLPPNTELIQNGEHVFAFPPDLSRGGAPNSLGRCQGPCRTIVTRKEAQHRPMGQCVKPT